MQNGMNKIGGEISFVAEYPGVLAIAFLALIASMYYFYIALKSRSFSDYSWKWSVGSIFAVPFIFYPIANLLMLPIVKISNSIESAGPNFIFPGWDLIFSMVTLYVLWKTKKLHAKPNIPLSNSFKIWLVLAIFLTTIVAGSITYYIFANNGPKDLGYSVVAPQANFSLHKISKIPDGYIYASDYSLITEENGEKSVKIALGSKLSDLSKNISPIVILQSKLTDGYDIKMDFDPNTQEVKTLEMPAAKNKIAYLGAKPMGNKTLYSLEFVTIDGVKIKIASPASDPNTVIEISKNIE
jgi:hypothetical protein